MKVLIAVNSLQQGGAERAAIKLASSLKLEGHHVQLLTWRNEDDFYEIPEGVVRLNLDPFSPSTNLYRYLPGAFSHRLNLVSKLFKFRRICKKEKINLFIGFESFLGAVMAIALMGTRIPVIVSERISPDSNVHETPKLARVLRPFIYEHGAICSVQSEGFKKLVKEIWGIESFITPNHVETDWLASPQSGERDRTVLALGRFDPQKDYPTLIKAWIEINKDFNPWKLNIYGRGDLSNSYFLAREHGATNINFYPPTKDARAELQTCGIFVSSSKYEGFPNVVLEALACGAPIISTLSTDVIADFEEEGAVIAIPVEDATRMAQALRTLMKSDEARRELSDKAVQVAAKYTWEYIGKYWEEIIKAAQASNGISFRKLIK